MIDPRDITRFDRSPCELLEFWLFCIVVAGKTAATQARLLQGFIDSLPDQPTLLKRLNAPYEDELRALVERSRLGQYGRLCGAFSQTRRCLSNDPEFLAKADTDELETIKGIGPKTARFFVMHARPDQRVAALDTHILKFLREQGVEGVPSATPTGRTYRRLEQEFLRIADGSGMSVADLDLSIWNSYAR